MSLFELMQISRLPPPISITAEFILVSLNSDNNDASTSPETIFKSISLSFNKSVIS